MDNYDFLRKIAIDIFGIASGGLNIHSFNNNSEISKESYAIAILNIILQTAPFFIHILTYKRGISPFKDKYEYKRIHGSKHHNNIKDLFNVSKYILNMIYSIMTIVYYEQKRNIDKDMFAFSVCIIVIDIIELLFYTMLYNKNSKVYARI
jgi:hypothetical protein